MAKKSYEQLKNEIEKLVMKQEELRQEKLDVLYRTIAESGCTERIVTLDNSTIIRIGKAVSRSIEGIILKMSDTKKPEPVMEKRTQDNSAPGAPAQASIPDIDVIR